MDTHQGTSVTSSSIPCLADALELSSTTGTVLENNAENSSKYKGIEYC